MSNTVHKKILPEYFDLVKKGIKKFELRKDEDDIQVNDFLVLDEWNGKEYTGRYVAEQVVYVLRNASQYGLIDGRILYYWILLKKGEKDG